MVATSNAEHYGFEVARTACLQSGTVYPLLARLEQYGTVDLSGVRKL